MTGDAYRRARARKQLGLDLVRYLARGKADWLDDLACMRCGGPAEHRHHVAPVEIFGRVEADCWPVIPLCADCHDRWHAAMGIGRRRRGAGRNPWAAAKLSRDAAEYLDEIAEFLHECAARLIGDRAEIDWQRVYLGKLTETEWPRVADAIRELGGTN